MQHPSRGVPVVRTRAFGSLDRRHDSAGATAFDIRYAPHTVLPVHAHEAPLFLLTLAGAFDETTGSLPRTCIAQRLQFRPAGLPHAQRFGPEGARCLAVELGAEPAAALREVTREREFRGRAALLAMRLADELDRPSAETSLVVEETVARLVEATRPPHDTPNESCPSWLSRASDLIDSRLAGSVRLADIARAVDRHPVHVSRCFRRHFGCDVADYVRQRRVHDACRRLRDSDEPLSQIAAACGFSDQSHMGRAFQLVLRRSPGAYRGGRWGR